MTLIILLNTLGAHSLTVHDLKAALVGVTVGSKVGLINRALSPTLLGYVVSMYK